MSEFTPQLIRNLAAEFEYSYNRKEYNQAALAIVKLRELGCCKELDERRQEVIYCLGQLLRKEYDEGFELAIYLALKSLQE